MQRLGFFRKAIALAKASPGDVAGQSEIARQDLSLAFEKASVAQEMRDEEQRLLKVRTIASNRFFSLTVVTLAISFVLSLVLFSIHYRLLTTELDARAQAEAAARESEESLRHLTSRLLQMQDEERRKFSRELHDSLGQYLAGVKMNLEMFARTQPAAELLAAIQLLDQSIAETRTISHLLHPPLLDEVGFSSAARWYVQGFSERSGIDVKLDMPDDLGRLPKDFELGLFRVLQESLTNIHRHSKSAKAEVTLQSLPGELILQVKDYGSGIPQDLLKRLRTKGAALGIGLSGMRERVRELHGHLDIQSSASGTLISVTLPLAAEMRLPTSSAAG
jgi:signal transduction histidine kinase